MREDMRAAVAEKLGIGIENVILREVEKNNGELKNGLMINRTGQETVLPCLYVDDVISRWKSGLLTLDEAAEEMIESYYEAAKVSVEVPKIDKELIMDQSFLVVINADRNESLLETMPHKRFLDLAAVVRVLIDLGRGGELSSIKVTNEVVEKLGIDADELFEAAAKNTEKNFPTRVRQLGQMVSDIMGEEDDDEMVMAGPPVLVLTNDQMMNGANIMCWPEKIGEYADRIGSDVYILPSSIHEVILQPMDDSIDLDDLKGMVYQINRSAVAPEEVLSDNVYLYRRSTGELSIA